MSGARREFRKALVLLAWRCTQRVSDRTTGRDEGEYTDIRQDAVALSILHSAVLQA